MSAIGLHLRPGVREHWLEWLREHDPTLAEAHESTYRRAYLPKAQQNELGERVRTILGKARAQYVRPGRSRSSNVPADYPPVMSNDSSPKAEQPEQPKPAVQLGLGL